MRFTGSYWSLDWQLDWTHSVLPLNRQAALWCICLTTRTMTDPVFLPKAVHCQELCPLTARFGKGRRCTRGAPVHGRLITPALSITVSTQNLRLWVCAVWVLRKACDPVSGDWKPFFLSQLVVGLKHCNESTNGPLVSQPLCQGSLDTAIAVWVLRRSILMSKKKKDQRKRWRYRLGIKWLTGFIGTLVPITRFLGENVPTNTMRDCCHAVARVSWVNLNDILNIVVAVLPKRQMSKFAVFQEVEQICTFKMIKYCVV